MSTRIKLSANFTLRELLWSNTAARNSKLLEQQFNPPGYLVETVLQPFREEFDWPIRVNSGYRCQELNELVGGTLFTTRRLTRTEIA